MLRKLRLNLIECQGLTLQIRKQYIVSSSVNIKIAMILISSRQQRQTQRSRRKEGRNPLKHRHNAQRKRTLPTYWESLNTDKDFSGFPYYNSQTQCKETNALFHSTEGQRSFYRTGPLMYSESDWPKRNLFDSSGQI